MDLVIKNGTIVTACDIYKADIGIMNGKIVTLSQDLSGDENIDAVDRYIFPGVIDVHTHMELPFMGTRSADNFYTGTRSAACGGVTTIIDFAIQGKNETIKEAIENRKNVADSQVVIDFALHAGLTRMIPETLEEIPDIINDGTPSFKLFMTYRKEGFMVDDGFLYAVLQLASQHGGLVGLHCENAAVLEYLVPKFLAEGKIEPYYHFLSRPNFVEGEATGRAITLAKAVGTSLYIFHMTCKESLKAVASARKHGFNNIYSETCPQYLTLTNEKYKEPDGINYLISPPLRFQEDINALWQGIKHDDIKIVSTDHCPFTSAQKKMGDTFATVPNGIGGVETLLPITYSEGVGKKRISLNQLVAVLSSNPANIFGLQTKGSISIGKDADIVIFNPLEKHVITASMLHSECDYTPYEGLEIQGYPETTISRGRIIFDKGKFSGEKGAGNYIKRWIT